MRQTKGEKRNGGFQAVVWARKRYRTEIEGFRLWYAPNKWREKELWVSCCGVRQTNGQNIKSGFQGVVCARQMERTGMVGFKSWCASEKEGE